MKPSYREIQNSAALIACLPGKQCLNIRCDYACGYQFAVTILDADNFVEEVVLPRAPALQLILTLEAKRLTLLFVPTCRGWEATYDGFMVGTATWFRFVDAWTIESVAVHSAEVSAAA